MKHKFVRRAVALALSFTLASALFVPAVVSADADNVVYSLATDEHIQGLAVGTTGSADIFGAYGNLHNVLRSAGDPTYTIVANPLGGNAIQVTGRANSWDSVDLTFERLGLVAGETYTLRFSGSARSGTEMLIGGADGPWRHFTTSRAADGRFEVTYTFTRASAAAGGAVDRIRLGPVDAGPDFTIYEITLVEGTDLPAISEAVEVEEPPAATAGGLATWQDVLDANLFDVNRAWQGNPEITATANGLVISGRSEVGSEGEHHGFAINLRALRALDDARYPEIVIAGTIEGTADRMFAQVFDGLAGRGDDDWTRAYIGNDGSFEITLTNEVFGVPGWADWALWPWIGAHPRGNMTITTVTIGGVSILEILGAAVEILEEEPEPAIDFGFPAGIYYSLLLDSFIQDLDASYIMDGGFPGIPHFIGAGSPTITIVGNPFGGVALNFTDRTNNWDGLDLLWRTLNLPEGRYTIQVVGTIELEGEFDPAIFTISGSSSPWGWVGEEEFPNEETGVFEIVRTFEISGDQVIDDVNGAIGGNIRLRPGEFLNNYTIYQIAIVAEGDTLPALPEAVAVKPIAEVVIIQLIIGDTSVTVNGVISNLEEAPFIAAGRTMVPLRFIAEAMGAVVGWTPAGDDHDGIVHLDDGITSFDLQIGEALYDNAGVYMGTSVILGAGRTMVPARFVAESLGAVIVPNLPYVTITFGDAVLPPIVTPPVEDIPAADVEDVAPPVADENINGSGILVSAVAWGDSGSGVNINIASGRAVWPFADEGTLAFEPVPGETYRLSFNVTTTGATGWRVRWMTTAGEGYPTYTAGDVAVVNNYPVSAGTIATVIPAHFNAGFNVGGTYTLVVDVTLDANETYNGLIGNITLRGTGGSSDWFPNWVRVEHVGEVVAFWESEN